MTKDKFTYMQAVEKGFQDTFRLNLQELVVDPTYYYTHYDNGNASKVDLDKDKDEQPVITRERNSMCMTYVTPTSMKYPTLMS